MKALSKITYGFVAILSLCSCGKGTKTTREKFLEKANGIEQNDPYNEAEIIYYYNSSVKEAGKDKVVEENRYTASFRKNKYGKWSFNRPSDKKAVDWFTSNVVDLGPAKFVNEDLNLFISELDDVVYYLDPYGVEYKDENKWDFFGIKYFSSVYLYFEWDEYGYLTSAKTKSEEKNDTGEYNILFTQIIKITYR